MERAVQPFFAALGLWVLSIGMAHAWRGFDPSFVSFSPVTVASGVVGGAALGAFRGQRGPRGTMGWAALTLIPLLGAPGVTGIARGDLNGIFWLEVLAGALIGLVGAKWWGGRAARDFRE